MLWAAYQWCAISICARPSPTSAGSASIASANFVCTWLCSPGSRSSCTASRISACRNAYPSAVVTSTLPVTAGLIAAVSSSSVRPVTRASSGWLVAPLAALAMRSTSWVSSGSRRTACCSRSSRESGISAQPSGQASSSSVKSGLPSARS